MVGLRGGGPVTTIICEDDLWQTLWSNILDEDRFNGLADKNKTDNKDKFPWCGETRISKNGVETTNQDIHPIQIYWSMPRRIQLIFKSEVARCNLCEEETDQVAEGVLALPYGIKYANFVHPLTPTYQNSKGDLLSVHQREAVAYKFWLGYVQMLPGKKKNVAEVINQMLNRKIFNFRLWVFGYDTKKNKVRCWYEGVMPVVVMEDDHKRELFEAEIKVIIQAADNVVQWLRLAVKVVMLGEKQLTNVEKQFWNNKETKNDLVPSQEAILKKVGQQFWQETEPDFYWYIAKLREDVMAGHDGVSVKQDWHKCIIRKAEQIFDEVSQSEMIDEVNVKRVAQARNKFMGSIWGKKVREEILGLPKKKQDVEQEIKV